MPVGKFQDNMHAWLIRTWEDRQDVFWSAASAVGEGSPLASSVWMKECVNCVYDRYNPPEERDSGRSRRLLDASGMPELAERQTVFFSENVVDEFDGSFLHVRQNQPSDSVPAIGRLYLRFDHRNLDHAIRLIRRLRMMMDWNAHFFPHFKMAGPCMHRERRDSVVMYLTEKGCIDRMRLHDQLKGVVPLLEGTVYGAQELARGVGFTLNPRLPPDPGDWRNDCLEGSNSFGKLLACYIARGLSGSGESFDRFCDRTADLLEQDGWDLRALYRLCLDTRSAEAERLMKTPGF